MTLQPSQYPELSGPVTAVGHAGGTPARQFTEPLREIFVLALLGANGVFLLLAISRLLFVIDGWASQFGLRSAMVFGNFVGLLALGLPMLALLLATHVAPMLSRSRIIMITVLAEYGVSALFGAITFLGAFAYDLSSARATIEGLLERGVWLGFLVLVCILAGRMWLGLFPPRPASTGYAQPLTYGRPYPGQPLYPQTTYPPARVAPPGGAGTPTPSVPSTSPITPLVAPLALLRSTGAPVRPTPPRATPSTPLATTSAGPTGRPASGSGWPAVPPPPMPGPLLMEDQTMRVARPGPGATAAASVPNLPAAGSGAAAPVERRADLAPGDATQLLRATDAEPPTR